MFARFARNVECDFFDDFQTLYASSRRCITLNFDELSLLKQWKQHKLLSFPLLLIPLNFPLKLSQPFALSSSILCNLHLPLKFSLQNFKKKIISIPIQKMDSNPSKSAFYFHFLAICFHLSAICLQLNKA